MLFIQDKNSYIRYKNYHITLKQKILSVISLVILCLMFASCKLDAPIYPDDPDFVPYQGKGGSSTVTVNLDFLDGVWEATDTYTELYAGNAVIWSLRGDVNLFLSIDLNNTSKTFTMDGSVLVTGGLFTTSGSGANTFIQLSQDPFNRITNSKIHITNLTANAMTWIVDGASPDPTIKSVYRVVLVKRP